MALTPRQKVLSPEEWERAKEKKEFRKIIPRREGSMWKGIVLRPRDVSFATQNPSEDIYMLLHRHWTSNVGWVVSSFLYALIPLLVYAIALTAFNFDIIEALGAKLSFMVVVVFYGLVFNNAVKKLVDWYFNLYIVTNERVLDYDFSTGLTSTGVSETALEGVDDVKEVSMGVLPSMFNYGDVSIYSAADKNVITFHSVPDPTFVRDKIADLADIASKRRYIKDGN